MKKRVKKRTRLIALLSALAALAAGGIGAGASFAAMAASRSSSASSYPSSSKGEKASLLEEEPKEQKFSPSEEKAVLASLHPENGGGIQGYYSEFPGESFPSGIGLPGILTSSTTGQFVDGSIWVPQGVDLMLFGTGGFASANGKRYNPNAISKTKMVELLEGGGYTGGVTVSNANNAQIPLGTQIPLLGLVSSSGQPWTESQIENSGISTTGTVQNEFMSKCMGYQWIAATSTTPGGPAKDETVAAGIVTDGVIGMATPSAVLGPVEQGLKKMGYTGTAYDSALKDIEAAFESPQVSSFQTAFKQWYNDKNSSNLAKAVSAAQDLLNDDPGFKQNLPMVCEAVWNGAVQVDEYENGSLVQTGAWQDLYAPGNDLNGNSSNPYISNFAAAGSGPVIAGCGQNVKECGISVYVDSLGCAFFYENFGNGSTVTASYFVSTQDSSSNAYSNPGALVENSLNINGHLLTNNFFVRQTGTSPTLFNPTSADTAFSTSTPSSSGLWFKAIDRQGQPLKQVKVLLSLLPSYNLCSYGSPCAYHPVVESTQPIDPFPWTGSGFNGDSYDGIGQLSSDLSSGSVTGLIGYLWYMPSSATAANDWALIPLNQVSNQKGVFEISGLPFGTYEVEVVSGENQDGQTEGYGSYYSAPSFQVNLNGYFSSSKPETMSAISDPCGFVDPSKDEVVVASNPSTARVDGSSLSSSAFSATVGSSNIYAYQAEAYLPFDLSGEKNSDGTPASSTPLTFTLSTPGQSEIASSLKANGISLSSLSGASVSVSSSSPNLKVTLSPSALSEIESKGDAPVGSSGGSLNQNGNRTLAITWQAYLLPSFTSSSSSTFEFGYEAYGAANPNGKAMALSPEVETNGPADNSVPSSLSPGEDSSKTGLWFKGLNADGSASTGAKFFVQNSAGDYLKEDTSSSGAFEGWSWQKSPSSALEFSQRNADAVFSFGGLQNGTYSVTQMAWPESVGKRASQSGTGGQNWPGIDSIGDLGGFGGGYPGYGGGSFQVTLSYSSPEAMSASADPAGLVDASKDSIYAFAPVKMAPLIGSSLSSQAYPTETVGVPFTEGWEGYLPMPVTAPDSTGGIGGYASLLKVSIAEDVNGLKMDNPSASNIEVAGVPLSTLVSNGASGSSGEASGTSVYTITLPYQALEYLEAHGKNAQGEPLSSSSNRLIIISFPAVMQTSFKNGGTFRQWMAFGSNWWTQNPGSGWYVSSSPLYTNGPADNSVPSSLSPGEDSSETGIWFKSLWYNTSAPAPGSKYTVQNASGQYLTPQESNGTFEGWSWSSAPYDFTERNSSALFSMGGLKDGAYTLTQVDPATGAASSSLSFTSTLSYSSPQSLKAIKDPLNLLDSSEDAVWAIAPASLPFTGGKVILIISLSAVTLFGAGALFFILRKRKRA